MAMLKRGDRVSLTAAEQRLAVYLARVREQSNIAAGVVRPIPLPPGRDGVMANLIGVGAELAFARLMNVYPDLTTHLRTGGPDCALHCGDRVDVKATPYVKTPLLVVAIQKQLGDADLYALMACAYPNYEFIGWAPEERVFKSVKDIGWGPSYVLEPRSLEGYLVEPGGA